MKTLILAATLGLAIAVSGTIDANAAEIAKDFFQQLQANGN